MTLEKTIIKSIPSLEWLQDKKKAGYVKHMGFSYHDRADLLDRILTEHPEVEFVQLQLNYLDWNSEAIQSRKCYEVCEKHGKPVVVMEPVKGGTLANVVPEVEQLFRFVGPVNVLLYPLLISCCMLLPLILIMETIYICRLWP